jgi:hypothetical protein
MEMVRENRWTPAPSESQFDLFLTSPAATEVLLITDTLIGSKEEGEGFVAAMRERLGKLTPPGL